MRDVDDEPKRLPLGRSGSFEPPVALRDNYRQLLQRWLRDTEHREAWDAWVEVVEGTIDLSTWAKERQAAGQNATP